MATENASVSILSQFFKVENNSLTRGYYRSRLFIAPFSTNPLIAAAGPIFSLLERLTVSSSFPPMNHLRENIEHELKAFQSRIHCRAYTEEFKALAYYLLCATIDEILGKSYLRVQKNVYFQAFTPSSKDEIGPEERFFDILSYLKENPTQNLDLLELAYYCLIAGFEGIQHNRPDGRQILDNLLEELFQLIRQYRVNRPYRLFKEQQPVVTTQSNRRQLFLISFTTLAILIVGYFLNQTILERKAKLISQEHSLLAKMDEAWTTS